MASWQSAMKVDPVAFTSAGVYSEVYGVGEEGNVANLFASLGLLEDAPDAEPTPILFILWRSRTRRRG